MAIEDFSRKLKHNQWTNKTSFVATYPVDNRGEWILVPGPDLNVAKLVRNSSFPRKTHLTVSFLSKRDLDAVELNFCLKGLEGHEALNVQVDPIN